MSALAPVSRASSATGRGPSASASAMRRSATIAERARRERAAHQVPEQRLGRALAHPRARATAAAASSTSASASVRQSSRQRPSRTTATTGGSPRRSGAASSSSTAQAKLGSSASGSAPPPTRATVSSTEPPTSCARRSARRAHRLGGLAEHAQHGHLPRGPLGVEVERERPLERREGELVGAERALERVAAQALDEVGAPRDDPRLRPAEQLVAREGDEVGARGEALARGRLVLERRERARAEVVDERQPVARRDGGQLGEARPLGEADDAEVRLVHREQGRRLGADRPLVVGRARAVRRPDLDEAGARALQHVGDAEAVADLDQLAARDEHLTALGERGERQQQRAGAVVDDERGLGAGEAAEDVSPGGPAASRAFPPRARTRGSSSRGRPRRPARARRRRAGRGRGSCARSRPSR